MWDSLLSRARASAVRETARAIDAAASAWVVRVDRGLDGSRAGPCLRNGLPEIAGVLERSRVHRLLGCTLTVHRRFEGHSKLRESPRARLWRRAMPWGIGSHGSSRPSNGVLGLARKRSDQSSDRDGRKFDRSLWRTDLVSRWMSESRVSVQYETATRRVSSRIRGRCCSKWQRILNAHSWFQAG